MDSYDVDKLLFAVLERTLKDVVTYHINKKSIQYEMYLDALDWFNLTGDHKGSESFVFSFPTICSRLGISPTPLRDRVNSIAEGNDDIPKHIMGGSLWKSKGSSRSSGISTGYAYPDSASLLLPYQSVSDFISWDTGYKGSSRYIGECLIPDDTSDEGGFNE